MRGELFRIYNLETGKSFIGQTEFNAVREWERIQRGRYKEAESALATDIKTLGISAFGMERLGWVDNPIWRNILESEYIGEYNSYYDGYNLTPGPDGDQREYMLNQQLAKKVYKDCLDSGKYNAEELQRLNELMWRKIRSTANY